MPTSFHSPTLTTHLPLYPTHPPFNLPPATQSHYPPSNLPHPYLTSPPTYHLTPSPYHHHPAPSSADSNTLLPCRRMGRPGPPRRLPKDLQERGCPAPPTLPPWSERPSPLPLLNAKVAAKRSFFYLFCVCLLVDFRVILNGFLKLFFCVFVWFYKF